MMFHGGRDHPVQHLGGVGVEGQAGQLPAELAVSRSRGGDVSVGLKDMSIFRLRDLCVSMELDPRGGKDDCVRRLEGAGYGREDFEAYGVGLNRTLSMIRALRNEASPRQSSRLRDQRYAPNLDDMDYTQLMELGSEMGVVPKGVTAQELEAVTVTHLLTATEAEAMGNAPCSVCLEAFKDDEETRRLPCLHVFHKACIDPWVTGSLSRSCPVCQWDLLEDPETL
eukprot:TRINITY_DN5059_c1_g1_i1.p1 TRINITY_DN5059_c1_g1~~TRINITY_DN5059_c1_g1_i1.p1  ORF type:complete len:225 (+),score=60.88 TRINITY_DN5059_c1_g1_i1:376-1050(+)